MNKQQPIGVLDSGVGGLSVLKCLHQLLPHENFIYVGDTARTPYGTRTDYRLAGGAEREADCYCLQHADDAGRGQPERRA